MCRSHPSLGGLKLCPKKIPIKMLISVGCRGGCWPFTPFKWHFRITKKKHRLYQKSMFRKGICCGDLLEISERRWITKHSSRNARSSVSLQALIHLLHLLAKFQGLGFSIFYCAIEQNGLHCLKNCPFPSNNDVPVKAFSRRKTARNGNFGPIVPGVQTVQTRKNPSAETSLICIR